ncbi:hypothetical protein HKD37_U058687 [Glycine soja]
MAKLGSPTNLASAIICFFASKKFPIRNLKASTGEGLQGKTLHLTTLPVHGSMNFQSEFCSPLALFVIEFVQIG